MIIKRNLKLREGLKLTDPLSEKNKDLRENKKIGDILQDNVKINVLSDSLTEITK